MGKVQINGVSYEVDGNVNVIAVMDGVVNINGRPVGPEEPTAKLEVIVEGPITGDLKVVNGSVKCGDVGGNVDAGGSVAYGDVGGNVDAGGSVICGECKS